MSDQDDVPRQDGEASLPGLVEDLHVGVVVHDSRARVVYANPAGRHLLGLTPDEIMGASAVEIGRRALHEDGAAFRGEEHPVSRVLATGEPVRGVMMGYKSRRSEEILWLLTDAQPRVGRDGKVERVVCSFSDVTDRKHTEARLQESEARYRQLVERARDIIFRTDVNGVFTYVNPAASKVLGYEAHTIVGRNFMELIAEEDRQRVEERLRAQFRERAASTYHEFRALPRDGRELWIGQHVQLLAKDRWVLGFQAVARDITEDKRAQRALEKERRQLHQIVARAPMAMAILDAGGRYLVHNDQWLRYWNPAGRTLVGAVHRELFPNDDDELADAWRRALRGESVSRAEDRFPLSSGAQIYVSWSLDPWHEPDGTVAGVVATVKDVDDQVAARRSAERTARSAAALLARVSRDMQGPLETLVDSARLLGSSAADPEREQAAVVEHCAQELTRLSREVHDYTAAETGQIELQPSWFDLHDLLDGVVEAFKEQAFAKGLRLECLVEDDVPGIVWGDPQRLRQVLENLLANAVRLTDEGGVAVRIGNQTGADDVPRVHFDVADTGPGIPPEQEAALFEPVFDGVAARGGGAGLGLAVSKRLVELMGGHIGVRSEPEQGSSFWFTVRLGPSEGASAEPDPQAAPPPRTARVLVAEDNRVNLKVTVAMLEALGYAVDAVGDGTEAVNACARQHYDAVLMDYQMPNMDGLKAAAWIREREELARRTPIIALTAGGTEGDRERCLAAGMDDYLSKPVHLEGLREALRRWIPDSKPHKTEDSGSALAADHPIRVLAEEAGTEVVAEVVELFLRTTPERVEALCKAHADKDLDEVGRMAHSLKGAAAQLGVGGIADVCAQVESSSQGSGSELEPLLDTLLTTWPATRQFLEKELRRMKSK